MVLCRSPPAAAGAPSVAAVSPPGTTADRARATACLAAAIYYEAANQPVQGRQAVAQVVLNRLKHPAFPKTICGVVYQGASAPGCQFSFACDGALSRVPEPRAWGDAMELARSALEGANPNVVGFATHYHTIWVHPAWSDALTRVSQIGDHFFYRIPGRPPASASPASSFAGSEPWIATPMLARPAAPLDLSAPKAAAATARISAFSVWGLAVATARPFARGEVSISVAPAS